MKRKGFTLIELLVSMAILAILSTIGFGTFQTTRLKAADAKKKSDLTTIAKSLEAYVNDHRSYPLSNSSGKIICQGTTTVCDWGNPLTDSTGTLYAATLPRDDTGSYYRYESTDGITYSLYALLQNNNDASIDESISVDCNTGVDCNYQLKSSNKP